MRSSGSEEEPQGRGADGEYSARSAYRYRNSKRRGSFWRELPVLIITALVLTIVIQAFLGRVYVIPSQSMEQTLHGCSGCNNDRVLVDKVTYRFASPEPGDVVVFRGPQTWGQNEFQSEEPSNPVARFFQGAAALIGLGAPDEKDFIKRVIATGGQTVECCDTQNRVLVDRKPLNEPYVYWEPGRGNKQKEFKAVTVPPGSLWVMGDNRNDSADSRVQGGGGVSGAVPADHVIGKARMIVLPPARWSGIPDPNPQAAALGAPAWHSAIPLGAGFAAAVPLVWLRRRFLAVVNDHRSREHY